MVVLVIVEGSFQSQQADLPSHWRGLLAKLWVSTNLQHSGASLLREGLHSNYKGKSTTLCATHAAGAKKKGTKVALMKI